MTITVVATNEFALARSFLPPTDRILQGPARVYLFYETNGGSNVAISDLDGLPILECRTFTSLIEADAWARHDMRRVS